MEDRELQTLLKQIRAGSSEAFDQFYGEFGRHLVRFFLRTGLAARFQDAEDLAQETLLKVWAFLGTGRQRFDSVASLRAYLMLVARSVAIDWIRRIRAGVSDVPLEDDERGQAALQTMEVVSRVQERIEARQEINEVLEDLSTNQKRALLMFEFEGLSYIEIAQIEGCSEGAVRSRLEEAREKIAKRLARQHDNSDAGSV